MRPAAAWIVVALALALACQNTGPLHLRSRADPTAEFDRYRTFSQAPPPASSEALAEYSEISGRKFAAVVGRRLQEAGLHEVPWDEADLQVALSIGGEARIDVWDWHYSVVVGSTGSMPVLTGSLRVDVYDRRDERMVWQGQAWQETMDAELGEARGLRAVERLMDRYPEGDPRR